MKKTLQIAIGLIFSALTCFSQYQILPEITIQCPNAGNMQYYVLSNNTNTILTGPGTWQITNGDIVNGSKDYINPVDIVWQDGYDQGKIVAKNGNGTVLDKLVISLLSVKHKTSGQISGSTLFPMGQQTVTDSI